MGNKNNLKCERGYIWPDYDDDDNDDGGDYYYYY